jgi:hypothetical protein
MLAAAGNTHAGAFELSGWGAAAGTSLERAWWVAEPHCWQYRAVSGTAVPQWLQNIVFTRI